MQMTSPQFATVQALDLAPLARPVAFEGCFGWLHPAHGPMPRKVGVVIVPGVGRDARCGHKPLRLLAEQLAGAGFATLRYDHPGQGEGLELAEGQDVLEAWTQGVAQAAQALRDATGVAEVVLVGLRLGATLAALAQADAAGLVLLAPVILGRRWLRELKVAAVLGGTGGRDDGEVFEAEGLSLASDTAARLSGLDLTAIHATTPKVLMIAQTEASDLLGEHLKGLGADVARADFPGYDMLFEDAHSNRAPTQVFDRVAAWLEASFQERATDPRQPPEAAAELRPPGAVERPVRFGEGLAGVLCQPDGDHEPRRAVIFCNTGGDPRVGIGGFAVQASRLLAKKGVASLRFDFAGLGDSPSDAPIHVYETSRQPDLASAISFLQEEGFAEVTLVGACAGAYHALAAARQDPRVGAVFAINAAKLIWRPGDSLAVGRRDEGKSTAAYKAGFRQAETWMCLLKGQVDVGAVAATLARRLVARWTRPANHGEVAALRGGMAAFAARGGRAHLLVGLDDPSLDEVANYFGPEGRNWQAHDGLTLSVRAGIDHGLALAFSRRIALAELQAFLGV